MSAPRVVAEDPALGDAARAALLALDPVHPAGRVLSRDARAVVVVIGEGERQGDGAAGRGTGSGNGEGDGHGNGGRETAKDAAAAPAAEPPARGMAAQTAIPLAVKVYRRSPWLAWTHPPGVASPAAREFAGLAALRAAGVPALEPVAALEWRVAGCVTASAVATRLLPAAQALDEVLGRTVGAWASRARGRFRRAAVRAAGKLVGQAHAAGLLHGRLSVKNLLCVAPGPEAAPDLRLADVPFLARAPGDLRGTPRALPELRSLDGRSWCFFTRTDRLRFLHAYLPTAAPRESRAARRALVRAFHATIGGPDAVRRYEREPGRQRRHPWLRRLLPPRRLHAWRAALALARGSARAPAAPQRLRLWLADAGPADRCGADTVDRAMRDLVEALAPHVAEVRVGGADPSWTARLVAHGRAAGVPAAGPDDGPPPALRARAPRCDRPWREVTVDADGAIRPCPGAPRADALGSLRTTPVRDVWRGAAYAAARRALCAATPDPATVCGRCRAGGFPYAALREPAPR